MVPLPALDSISSRAIYLNIQEFHVKYLSLLCEYILIDLLLSDLYQKSVNDVLMQQPWAFGVTFLSIEKSSKLLNRHRVKSLVVFVFITLSCMLQLRFIHGAFWSFYINRSSSNLQVKSTTDGNPNSQYHVPQSKCVTWTWKAGCFVIWLQSYAFKRWGPSRDPWFWLTFTLLLAFDIGKPKQFWQACYGSLSILSLASLLCPVYSYLYKFLNVKRRNLDESRRKREKENEDEPQSNRDRGCKFQHTTTLIP